VTTPNADRPQLTRLQRRLVIAVAAGATVIAGIGFVGSYTAVARLAETKGFGAFARIFPVGIDAGILVLLALDLLLTWIRIPFPLLRHTAWLLTAATIAFNGAAAWPDPLGVSMHAVIPVLFVVVVEAARHAIGRTADITADKHMEGVRLSRWLLSPLPTFLMWRRMKLWELRSYDAVIALEQQRLVERARLRSRYGRRWRSKAPVDAVMALRLTRYGRALGAPIEGVLAIEHAPSETPGSPPAQPALPPAQPVVSREPAPGEPEPADFETTVDTALKVTSGEPRRELAAAVLSPSLPLATRSDQVISREPGLSPAEPVTVTAPEPRPEPTREPATEPAEPETSDKERQITDLASRLRNGERLTKDIAADLLGVSPATAGRRLKDARTRIGDGTGQYL
jgi:hypothetical protein